MSAVPSVQEQARERYRELLARATPSLPGQELDWLNAQRAKATAEFLRLGFPTRKDEAWRYSGVDRVLQQQTVADAPPLEDLSLQDIERLAMVPDASARLVFANGVWRPELSHARSLPPEAQAAGLRAALKRDSDAVGYWLGSAAGTAPSSFGALNTALLSDGVWISIPADARLAGPIELIYLSGGTDAVPAFNPRNLIVLENGAHATVVEQYLSVGPATCFTNGVTEVLLGDAAELAHYRLQDESRRAMHLSSLFIRQGRSSRYRGLAVSLGAAWSRTEYHNRFEQPQARCDLDGLYLVDDDQLSDFHLDIGHRVPGCTSRERFKGLLLGRGRAVFDGRVRVETDAQQSDAVLSNHNLMLSPDAEVDTKPQLEIFADDVRCAHGTTVGQLEPAQMFYLRSRGIPAETARRMLCLGFAAELLAECAVSEFCLRVERRLQERLTGTGETPATD